MTTIKLFFYGKHLQSKGWSNQLPQVNFWNCLELKIPAACNELLNHCWKSKLLLERTRLIDSELSILNNFQF